MVDIIIVGLIAFSILISLWRGFVSEALSLVWRVSFIKTLFTCIFNYIFLHFV